MLGVAKDFRFVRHMFCGYKYSVEQISMVTAKKLVKEDTVIGYDFSKDERDLVANFLDVTILNGYLSLEVGDKILVIRTFDTILLVEIMR